MYNKDNDCIAKCLTKEWHMCDVVSRMLCKVNSKIEVDIVIVNGQIHTKKALNKTTPSPSQALQKVNKKGQ